MESLISLLQQSPIIYLEKDREKLPMPKDLKEEDLISMIKNEAIITDGKLFQFRWENDFYRIDCPFLDDSGKLKSLYPYGDKQLFSQFSAAVERLAEMLLFLK